MMHSRGLENGRLAGRAFGGGCQAGLFGPLRADRGCGYAGRPGLPAVALFVPILSLFRRHPEPEAPLPVPGLPGVTVALRRSARARRLSLRVARGDGAVVLTLPTRASRRMAAAFVAERAAWIAAARARAAEAHERVAPGTILPVEGVPLTLAAVPGRGAPRVAGGELVVPGDPARAAARAEAFLRALARDRLAAACDRHAAALGRTYAALTLRDPASRWGSCTAAGRLMFSWRLVLAPPAVLDYVAAHEVAHLARMDHSPAFWALVERLCPGHAAPRDWLRAEGSVLHRFRFTA
jgi:hypothetical protein